MTYDLLIDLVRDAFVMMLRLGVPLLLVSLAVGLVCGLFQTMTQLQDQTISLVPRLLVMLAATLFLLPWAISELVDFASELIVNIPSAL